MDVDVNVVIDEMVAEIADKIRQIAILRAQVKLYQAREAEAATQDVPTPN